MAEAKTELDKNREHYFGEHQKIVADLTEKLKANPTENAVATTCPQGHIITVAWGENPALTRVVDPFRAEAYKS